MIRCEPKISTAGHLLTIELAASRRSASHSVPVNAGGWHGGGLFFLTHVLKYEQPPAGWQSIYVDTKQLCCEEI